MVTAIRMQDSRSVGAIAGLAVAIVFTWRVWRSPSGPQRGIPKRQGATPSSSGASAHSSSNVATSGVISSSEDSNAQNVINDFFQPVKVEANPSPLWAALIKCNRCIINFS